MVRRDNAVQKMEYDVLLCKYEAQKQKDKLIEREIELHKQNR